MVERTQPWIPSRVGSGPIAAQTEPSIDPSASGKPMPRGFSRIGRYHVLKVLGEGGMGVVYSAFDEELDRRIAIKVLASDVGAEAQGRTRMIREAQAMAKLSHPNVVHVYEVGEFQGHVYVAMEFVRGMTLREWLDTHGVSGREDARASLRERLEIVMQAGEGLAAAHAAGIVHRDFKPENVMVADLPPNASAFGRARVLDFGLARGADTGSDFPHPERLHDTLDGSLPERAGSVLSVELTRHGSIMGTPAYMSPEQHFGLPVDAASDQFNFCVVLYEALYGVRPFRGENRLALAYATRYGQVDPPPPGSEIPARLREVVVRGLAPESPARWSSMRALLDALRVAADPPRTRARWPVPVIAGLLVVVAGLAAALQFRPTAASGIPSAVESLAASARLWGSRARWVYPDKSAPEQTALRAVAALRALEGELDEPGELQAVVLAREFADTLARLGDNYWEAEGGRVFARDFYAQALLFDPELARARARSGFLAAELADLRHRAEMGEFSPDELVAADELADMAAPVMETSADEPPIHEAIAKVAKEMHDRAAKRRAERSHVAGEVPIDRGAEQIQPPPTESASVNPPTIVEPPVATASVTPPSVAEPVAQPEPEPGELDNLVRAELADPEAMRERAKQLVAEAHRLKQQGKREAALKKMFEATRIDRRCAPAWDGLRDLHFQIGAYQEAVQYGEKAVKLAPSNGQYHLRLGEAHWKLKEYDAAEKAWTRALHLGVAHAKDRLATLPGH